MMRIILFGVLGMFLHLHFAHANYPEYGSRECANCYDQQDKCYRQNMRSCTNAAIPCIQQACTKTKINR